MKILTRVKIRIFPISIAYWSRFRVFEQNRDNPDEIGIVGQSGMSFRDTPLLY